MKFVTCALLMFVFTGVDVLALTPPRFTPSDLQITYAKRLCANRDFRYATSTVTYAKRMVRASRDLFIAGYRPQLQVTCVKEHKLVRVSQWLPAVDAVPESP